MFARLFRTDPMKKPARAAYEAVLSASRRPEFYRDAGAPDTVDARFDMLLIHAVIFFRRVRGEGAAGAHMNQLVFDIMFDDMDAALREMGTGDPSVGKRIKEMGQAFYGRAEAYEAALNATDEVALSDIILRNIFASDDEDADAKSFTSSEVETSNTLAAYMLKADAAMAQQDAVKLIEGAAPAFPSL